MPLDDTMKLAILEKMGEQLQGIADILEETQPDFMSKVTYHNTLRNARAQLEAIKWAHSCCALTMGSDALNFVDHIRKRDGIQ